MLPWLLTAATLIPQAKPPAFPLTVDSIMRGDALVGKAPRGLRWSPDGSELTFSWAKPDGTDTAPAFKNYVVKRDGTGLRLGDGRDWKPGPARTPRALVRPPFEAYLSQGDAFLKRSDGTGEAKRLTTDAKLTGTPVASFDGTVVAYLKDGDVFAVDVATGTSSVLVGKADITSPAAPTGESRAETELAKTQSQLFKHTTSVPAGSEVPRSTPGRFGRPDGGLNLNPSATHLLFTVSQPGLPGRTAMVPAFVTPSGYTEMLRTYPKVGIDEGTSKHLLVNLKTGKRIEIAPPRAGRVSNLWWSPDGRFAATWVRATDHKDAWLYTFDSQSDQLRLVWTEHDDAWIGGPGNGVLGWFPDSSRIYFQSENTGFANLMTMAPDGSDSRNLTPGDYEVSDLSLDEENRRFVFVSSEGSPFGRHVDAIGLDGSGKQKLADLSADEDAAFAIAPDGKTIAVVKSTPNAPAELFVNGVQVTSTPTDEWKSYRWMTPETVMLPARDGSKVPARLYRGKKWRKGGPAVIFVHGAGYLQNVYDGWSHYFREYMFHNLLAERGYAVLDIDYRGSAGYGKAWRTGIYRRMGGKDLDDQVDGAKFLIEKVGAAKDRIGIYGGSYGGFITLMAMFRTPDVFAAGAALRPVTDWAHYNHGYTSNILNWPQDDPEAYRFSSPIYYAEGLKGALLICHGMVDTNVHYQDTVRLAQRLIELRKRNWEVAGYPVENHSFEHPESWADEYTRILNLFERTIGSERRR